MFLMLWDLRKGKDFLRPLIYSNGKSQLDIANEAISAFDSNKFVLLDGICGTGKSSIALHCCKNFGKSIIVVPTKHLQDQYHNDYSKEMNVHGMKIKFLKGRGNFKCRYESNKVDCNFPSLPCIAHLGSGEKRHEKCKCTYWSPIYLAELAKKILSHRQGLGISNIELKQYNSPGGAKCQVVRDPACGYYKQYFSFWDDTNVIVMNDRIWELMLYKKPEVELEVIDEYDGLFDSLYFDEIVSFTRLGRLYPREEDASKGSDSLMDVFRKKNELASRIEKIAKEADTDKTWAFVEELRDFALEVLKEHDDSSLNNFAERLDVCLRNRQECDLEFDRSFDGEGLVHIIMPNPFVVLQRLFSNSKRVLLMSATPHSPNVLRDFFKIKPTIVKAETAQPGTLYLVKSDMKYVNHRGWSDEGFRKEYYDIYRKIIRAVPKNEKTLIQSQSLKYSGTMAKEFGISVDSSQSDFYGNSGAFAQWVKGDFNMLISTKCKRGIDLKDDLCRNIIIDKMPYPDKSDRKFKSIEKRFPEMFSEIYNDIARRTLIQLVARGLRHKDDWVRVYTPDLMVYDKLKKLGVFRIKEIDIESIRHHKQSSLGKAY